MEPRKLRLELENRGLSILGVTWDDADPEVLVVYLHGNAGQWRDGAARLLVATVPGVRAVSESPGSAAILLVDVGPVA